MPTQCDPGQGEYLEDFSYFAILRSLLLSPADEEGRAKSLVDFEQALQGGESARFEVAKALCAKDEAQLARALAGRQQAWKEAAAESRDPYDRETTGKLFLEGVAMCRLAGRLGLKVPARIPSVPRELLRAQHETFPEEFEI
ncbi:MAG: hypothetical protein QM767_16005 [Anaeromyxobacter sp.]